MLTQGVMQGIACSFIFPVSVRVLPTLTLPLCPTHTTVCISFPMVPQKTSLLDRDSLGGKLLRYGQVFDAS
jgi:hypothetical protein